MKMPLFFRRLLLLVPLLAMSLAANASHFRYGSLSYQTSGATNRAVSFKLNEAFREDFFGAPPVVGQVVNTGEPLYFGDGTSTTILLTITAIGDDYFFGEFNTSHTYNASGTFTAYTSDCCRISNLQNNADQYWYVSTPVVAGNANDSPVSTLRPIVNLATGNATATYTLPAGDPDGNTLTYSVATSADLGSVAFTNAPGLSVNSTTGVVTFSTVGKPINNVYNAVIKVSDGTTSIIVDHLIQIVGQTSAAPVFVYPPTPTNGQVFTVSPGTPVTFVVRATDPNLGDVVTLSGQGLPTGSTFVPSTGNPVQSTFSWTPTAANVGTTVVNFLAQDNNGTQASTSVTIQVQQPVRVAPVTVADSYSTPAGVTLTGNVLTNDLGTNPRAILITRPTNGSLVLNPDGSFTYVPNAGFVGTDSFTYYACDPSLPLLCGNPATVSITVTRVAPTTVADNYTTPAGVTLTGNVLTNDLGTNPRAILITRPTNGTLVLNPNGSFTYVPNAGFSGTDSFLYYACDPNQPLLCGNPATVSITVTRVAPITVADIYATPQGVTLTGNVLTNDLGTNPRAILLTRPTRGTLVLNPNGTFTYVPNAGFSGTDSFTYYACNMGTPLVCGDPATVSITVLPANTATRSAAQAATTSAKPAAPAAGGATIALELALAGHPNPFSDELQLSFALPLAQAYTLAVYDAQGRLVQQLARGQAEAGQAQELKVPTHTYAAGLYLVRLTTNTGTRQLKLIK